MKKTLIVLVSLMLVLSFVACDSKTNEQEESTIATQATTAVDSEITSSMADSSGTTDWRQFLADYEKFIDDYIELAKKYKENPTDASILSDYTEFSAKAQDLTKQAEELKNDLNSSPEELKEYSEKLQELSEKLSNAIK